MSSSRASGRAAGFRSRQLDEFDALRDVQGGDWLAVNAAATTGRAGAARGHRGGAATVAADAMRGSRQRPIATWPGVASGILRKH